MSKFYEVSKVLDKRTDSHGRVQYLVRWRGYGKKNDSWVDEADTNERLKQVFRTRHQGTPGLLQTFFVLSIPRKATGKFFFFTSGTSMTV